MEPHRTPESPLSPGARLAVAIFVFSGVFPESHGTPEFLRFFPGARLAAAGFTVSYPLRLLLS